MKLLLGGVPLGCDNIGDEAIIACVVVLLRSLFPDVEITVCTKDQDGTAQKLNVKTAPLYGFPPEPQLDDFSQFVKRFDAYIWFGATGLSDYPDTALPLLAAARRQGVKTIVWCVGMDSQLNPAFFKVQGKKRMILKLFGAVKWYESRLRRAVGERIRSELSKCAFVSVRDPQSSEELKKIGLTDVVVAADTAILQPTAPQPPFPIDNSLERIGFCISAQREITHLDQMLQLWDDLTEAPARRLVLLPMNPKTDKPLMWDLSRKMKHPDRVELLESDDPAVVQAATAQCRVVVSSRLHLLILSSNVGTPIVGVTRGSKIPNWLANFGLKDAGSVYECDFAAIKASVEKFIAANPAETMKSIATVMDSLHKRLDSAAVKLKMSLTT
ncbi:MAG: polysaccharide pyruvyl transferase family protein [Victivallales bacterium]|nr:polysaccharide pyruvyl transferase family protein [Victivallales bacterium]